jgi:hypothetical protein
LNVIESEQRPGKKGHGRRAASDYSAAKIVNCQHPDLKSGDICPSHLKKSLANGAYRTTFYAHVSESR